MPFTPPTWTNGSTPLSAANMTTLGTQYTESTNSFEQDILQAFVFSGLVCTKDGTTANQLDVTLGVGFFLQSGDSTLRRRAFATSTGGQFTTSALSATYYLDANADGTWSFATSHSGVANYLSIAQVTTDGSGNILAITDERVTTINFFTGALATGASINGNALVTSAGGSLSLSSLTVTGATTFHTAPKVSVTLGGVNQKVYEMSATDGHDYSFYINNSGAISLYDLTASVTLMTWTAGLVTASSLLVTGTATFDAPPLVTFALAGSNQKFLELKATDGQDYAFIIETNGTIGLYDYTNATWAMQWTSAGVASASALEATASTPYAGGNYALLATASNGAIYSDGGHFKTSGSGTVIASAFTPALGNSGFNCRGNFSGTGSGTFSHGAGTTPLWVGITCSQASSSMTVGAASYTATQVTVSVGAAYTWLGIAL